MINLRNIRISFLYIINLIMLILIITFLINSNMNLSEILMKNSIKGGFIFSIMILCMIGIFSSLIHSIIYFFKSYKTYKVYSPQKYIIKWIYTRTIWNKFIIYNFKINLLIEVKALLKAAIRFYVITIPVVVLCVIYIGKYRNHNITILTASVIVFIIGYALPIISKMFINCIGHIIFTNKSIIMNKEYIIINEEIFSLNMPKEKHLISKKIRNGNIEIKYSTISRSANRYDNNRDIHLLIIPIPKNKISEANLYISK